MTGDERASSLRVEAERVLVPLADLAAPVPPGREASYEERVRVAERQVQLAADCGASLAFDGAFEGWRTAFARRRIGRLVLERMRKGATADPSSIARAVVADLASDGRDGLSQWLATLGAGGAATVVRDAATWAVAARAEMHSWPPHASTSFDNPPAHYRWSVPLRAVQLEADADGVTRATGSLLLLADATAPAFAPRQVAWLALVATLSVGVVPRQVTRIDLASGDRRTTPVTDDVLDSGLTAAARAVEAVMAVAYTAPEVPTPGRWCRRCRGRESCAPGVEWLHASGATTRSSGV